MLTRKYKDQFVFIQRVMVCWVYNVFTALFQFSSEDRLAAVFVVGFSLAGDVT